MYGEDGDGSGRGGLRDGVLHFGGGVVIGLWGNEG